MSLNICYYSFFKKTKKGKISLKNRFSPSKCSKQTTKIRIKSYEIYVSSVLNFVIVLSWVDDKGEPPKTTIVERPLSMNISSKKQSHRDESHQLATDQAMPEVDFKTAIQARIKQIFCDHLSLSS